MPKRIKNIILICLLFCVTTNQNRVFAQSFDTVYMKANQVLVSLDTMYFGNQDSIVIIPDSIKYVVTKSFVGSIDLLNKYYKSVFIDTVGRYDKAQEAFEKAQEYYEPYEGRIIRNVSIRQVEMFMGNVLDTTSINTVNGNKKSEGRRKFSSRKWIIRQNLRIEENTELNPALVSENERLIRSLPYIEDARIYVQPDSVYIDSIDLIIVTKDNFPLGIGGSFSGFNKFSISPYTRNAFGFGHTIQPTLFYNQKGDPKIGYGGEYVIPNISGWFVRTKFDFENTYKRERYRINVSKPFVTNDVKYGGGVEYYRLATESTFKEYFYPDSVRDTVYRYSMDYYNIWFARSFFFQKDDFSKFLNLSGRYSQNNYITHPTTSADSNYIFHDQYLMLFRLSYQQKHYYKTSRLMAFGVTEDVPYGLAFSLLGGYQFNKYYNRPYAGFEASWTQFIDKVGYFAYQVGAGTFFNNRALEDLKLGSRILYFSPYIHLNRFGIRHFGSVSANSIANPRYLEYEDFGDAIRKLKQNELFGQSTLVLRYEPYFYSPYKILGFQIAWSLFADVGWITEDKYWTGNWTRYAAIGMGLHLKNESLTFPTLSIQVAYFPRVTGNQNNFQVYANFDDREIFKNDYLGEPELYFDF